MRRVLSAVVVLAAVAAAAPTGHPTTITPTASTPPQVAAPGNGPGEKSVFSIDIDSAHTAPSGAPHRFDPADMVASQQRSGVGYTYIQTFKNKPVRWNPCQPITYQMNLKGAPVKDAPLIHNAIKTLAARTGLTFKYTGPTTLIPDAATDVAKSGTGIIIAWAKPEPAGTREGSATDKTSSALLKGTEGAVASPYTNPYTTTQYDYFHLPVYFAGALVVNTPNAGQPAVTPAMRRTLYLHELAHLFNLNHVQDPTQVMYPTLSPNAPTNYSNGDRAGLQGVHARHGCLELPALPEDATPEVAFNGDNITVTSPTATSNSGPVVYRFRNNTTGATSKASKQPTFTIPLRSIAPFVGDDYTTVTQAIFHATTARNKVGQAATPSTYLVLPRLRLPDDDQVKPSVTSTTFTIATPQWSYGETGVAAANLPSQPFSIMVTGTDGKQNLVNSIKAGETYTHTTPIATVEILSPLHVWNPHTSQYRTYPTRGTYTPNPT